MNIHEKFRKISNQISLWTGSVWAFFLACLSIVIWSILGPHYRYSDTWQLIINTGTTVLTFLMVFIIQNTQNRHSKEMQVKIDELIRALEPARNDLIELEKIPDKDLDKIDKDILRLSKKTAQSVNKSKKGTK